MKLELLFRPQIYHVTIGKNLQDLVSEYDKTDRKPGDVIEVLSSKFIGLGHHLHYGFYFHLPVDFLTEIVCYTNLKATRNEIDDNLDEGILTGSVQEFLEAMLFFCKKGIAKEIRGFFNAVAVLFEADGIQIPFNKHDLGDHTYAVTR